MSLIKSISLFATRRDSLIYPVILVSLLTLTGWLTGHLDIAASSSKLIPIPHASILIFLCLGVFLLVGVNYPGLIPRSVTVIFLSFLIFLTSYLLLNYFFKFTDDIERVFMANPAMFRNYLVDRISPISALLFILLYLGLLGYFRDKTDVITYIGCYSSFITFLVSTIILIGYLYKAPLLYGSKIVPVSLPSGINFFLLSFTIMRFYDFPVWMLNNRLWDNNITRQLIKSFLPIIIPLIILDGFLDSRVQLYNANPPVKAAIIIILVVAVTVFMIIRISKGVGNELLSKQKKLKENEIKFRTVADYTWDWEFWLGIDNSFMYCSPSCKRITGYDKAEFLKNPGLMTRIIHPEDLESYMNHLNEDNITKPCQGLDYRIITSSGETRWLAHVCQPVFDENGTLTGRRGSGRDITERMNAAIQIRELNKKLSMLNSDKDRFIAILGHDLKNPINNILGLTEVLKEELNDLSQAEIRNFIEDLNKSACMTNNLLEDILVWARSQEGKLPYKPKLVSIGQVYQQVIDILTPNALAKNITIYQQADEINVIADPAMFKTILLNLVTNAIKFTGPDGRININAHEDPENVTITVSDTGVGISPVNIARLFDMTQVISTRGTAQETGTGLGLLLCKDFVEKHGGKIWVESEYGSGSDFKFTLPKSTEHYV